MISGRAFAEFCQWNTCPRYPDLKQFVYQFASDGDWVFLNGDYISRFTSKIPVIHFKKFVLVIHNMDTPFGPQQFSQLSKHAKHIYAINNAVNDPMVTTIPIGFADRYLELLKNRPMHNLPREYEIYCNFTVNTNAPKRRECLDAVKNDPRVVYKGNRSFPEYYEDLCRSRFVLCPEGEGADTHRVYESILCGATPVVLRNRLSSLYEKLPVCIVNKWTDPYYEVHGKSFSTSIHSYI